MKNRIKTISVSAFRGRKKWILLIAFAVLIYWFFSLPDKLFTDPYSAVLQSRDGQLLSASIASDGQWRFPQALTIPSKFTEAIIAFEDKRFNHHPGVDILSLGRAFTQNIQQRRIVSGGSTISMQVIRLSRKGNPRTVPEKLTEVVLATRLELRYSKEEILSLYASHAPFGGNVVGLEAACWRYFGTTPDGISWSQAALLAVLPNSPALIHPGRNRKLLKAKRDHLLEKLEALGKIDHLTCALAKEELLPEAPYPLPRLARHLLARASKEGYAEQKLTTTIDYHLQHRVEEILQQHHQRLSGNQVYNAAALILDVETGEVLAYAGNIDAQEKHENEVDVITSPRSTGSILKPFLYAAMLDEGKILPHTLLPDVPLIINGFSPKNFSHGYDGAVHADKALIRSLNVPAVHLLKAYRYEKFHTLLKNMGMKTLNHSPDHYGLSLILGGAEGTLWDITGMYASMSRTLNHYFDYPGSNRYLKADFHAPRYIKTGTEKTPHEPSATSWLSASSVFLTMEALKEVYRPGEESGWRHFNSSKKIAWKTGTSFGFRDGWAVGVTPQYAVGVWTGNADGEGRPGLTGTDTAAPIMFDIFSQLPSGSWFRQPLPEMQSIIVCKASGYRASPRCNGTDTVWIAKSGLSTSPCPFHKTVHLTKDRRYQVHDGCIPVADMVHANWFVLPPVQEHYYKSLNISYKSLPPFRSDCETNKTATSMDIVYPKENSKIYIPRELDGKPGSTVFELAHRNPGTTVYWHLDGKFLGTTRKNHHMGLNLQEGKHILSIVDDQGETMERHFEIISKR